MITVKVADEDMADAMNVNVRFRDLKLRAFTTIDQEMTILDVEMLGRGEPAICRDGTTGPKYG